MTPCLDISAMPPGEELENLAATGATLAIHLSINNLVPVVRQLTPHYGADCPVAVAYRVSWPDEQLIAGTLATIREAPPRRLDRCLRAVGAGALSSAPSLVAAARGFQSRGRLGADTPPATHGRRE